MIKVFEEDFKNKSHYSEKKFLYLGKTFLLDQLIDTKDLTEDELSIRLKKFYITECKKIVIKRVKFYQAQLRVKPKSIEIDESKTKWGSCNSNKKLTFNYRLAMTPPELIDYVVVHELCHILHMNHDRSFWRKLGSIIPDYKKREDYLKIYGMLMSY